MKIMGVISLSEKTAICTDGTADHTGAIYEATRQGVVGCQPRPRFNSPKWLMLISIIVATIVSLTGCSHGSSSVTTTTTQGGEKSVAQNHAHANNTRAVASSAVASASDAVAQPAAVHPVLVTKQPALSADQIKTCNDTMASLAKQDYEQAGTEVMTCFTPYQITKMKADEASFFMQAPSNPGTPDPDDLLKGYFFFTTTMTAQNYRAALYFFNKAAASGNTIGYSMLGNYEINGGAGSVDSKKAYADLTMAANNGYAPAMLLLAQNIAKGEFAWLTPGISQDLARKYAAKGDTDIQYAAEARKWAEAAAALHFGLAEDWIAHAYLNDVGPYSYLDLNPSEVSKMISYDKNNDSIVTGSYPESMGGFPANANNRSYWREGLQYLQRAAADGVPKDYIELSNIYQRLPDLNIPTCAHSKYYTVHICGPSLDYQQALQYLTLAQKDGVDVSFYMTDLKNTLAGIQKAAQEKAENQALSSTYTPQVVMARIKQMHEAVDYGLKTSNICENKIESDPISSLINAASLGTQKLSNIESDGGTNEYILLKEVYDQASQVMSLLAADGCAPVTTGQ